MIAKAEPPSGEVVVLDASTVIDLIDLCLLEATLQLHGAVFVIPEQAIEEVERPSQRDHLTASLDTGRIRRWRLEDPSEIEIMVGLSGRLGAGEAACLAAATHHGWVLACEERNRRFEREVERLIGMDSLVRVEQLLARVVLQGIMTSDELGSTLHKAASRLASDADESKTEHALRVLDRVLQELE